ncbi:Txe/YoeB family addiction module toxin [Pseudodesulfovibrio portus]|uniref:Putative mRNA interferase YoeB n=1 Tax=Pseudodesulfovibrio portus TaxID=231439 RepID=A0ABM8AQZ9_9BACT|nr:Txe/YoeB family addiction module toxin [Pseudodesulfovibrio portus]BDQ33854.1 toxin YoeB [Pseudodesulfovibrio portus]
MRLTWTEHGWEDYLYWQKADKKMVKRINLLIRDALRTPFEGRGKPEPLRFDLTGYWSRRIDREHRLVYAYDSEADALIIAQCRYHY